MSESFAWSCPCGQPFRVYPVTTGAGGRSVRFRRSDIRSDMPFGYCPRCHRVLLAEFKKWNALRRGNPRPTEDTLESLEDGR